MSNYANTQVIIMAGGVGSRFWPMSTPQLPQTVHRCHGHGTFPHPAHRGPFEANLSCREHVGSDKREIHSHCQGANP